MRALQTLIILAILGTLGCVALAGYGVYQAATQWESLAQAIGSQFEAFK